uniref:Uncharacterized protein n=1 Tax=Octopus bimaculoides TaxID=37653 RepID=A0A0L8GEG1_OCTBM
MSSRKYLSGYQKRQLKEKQSNEISKCQKLSNYFTMSSKSLSSPATETTHTRTSEVNDRVQTTSALFSNNQPTLDTFGADNDHGGQELQEKREQKRETGSKFSHFKENSDLANWPVTIDNDFIQNCLMQDISFFLFFF